MRRLESSGAANLKICCATSFTRDCKIAIGQAYKIIPIELEDLLEGRDQLQKILAAVANETCRCAIISGIRNDSILGDKIPEQTQATIRYKVLKCMEFICPFRENPWV